MLPPVKGYRASTVAGANCEALIAAMNRLQRVTGWYGRDFQVSYEHLPLTGDDIKIKVIWSR